MPTMCASDKTQSNLRKPTEFVYKNHKKLLKVINVTGWHKKKILEKHTYKQTLPSANVNETNK